MDLGKASQVICLTLVAVAAVNLLIYLALRRGVKIKELDIIREITASSRKPWNKESEDLEELSKLVESLKSSPESDEKKQSHDA